MRRWLRATLLLLFYGLWFFVFSWPLGAHFAAAFLAEPSSDAGLFAWNVWHFDQAVAAGQNPFFTTWIFYPQGISLLLHTYTPILGLLGLADARGVVLDSAIIETKAASDLLGDWARLTARIRAPRPGLQLRLWMRGRRYVADEFELRPAGATIWRRTPAGVLVRNNYPLLPAPPVATPLAHRR